VNAVVSIAKGHLRKHCQLNIRVCYVYLLLFLSWCQLSKINTQYLTVYGFASMITDLQYSSNASSHLFDTCYSRLEHSHSTIEGVKYEKRSREKSLLGSLNCRASWFLSDLQLQNQIFSRASRTRVASHDRVWKHLPVSNITFHNVRNHKAVYTQRCLFIWFIVCLSLIPWKFSLKPPRQPFIIFSRRNEVTPTIAYAFLWSLWKPRGTPRESPFGKWVITKLDFANVWKHKIKIL